MRVWAGMRVWAKHELLSNPRIELLGVFDILLVYISSMFTNILGPQKWSRLVQFSGVCEKL